MPATAPGSATVSTSRPFGPPAPSRILLPRTRTPRPRLSFRLTSPGEEAGDDETQRRSGSNRRGDRWRVTNDRRLSRAGESASADRRPAAAGPRGQGSMLVVKPSSSNWWRCGARSSVASQTTNGRKRGPNSSRAIARLTAQPSSPAPGRGPHSIASPMRWVTSMKPGGSEQIPPLWMPNAPRSSRRSDATTRPSHSCGRL